MSSVLLVATLPTTRVSGKALALTEIASLTILRDIGDGNGPTLLQTIAGPFTAPTVNATDPAPATGNDIYSFYVVDSAGLQGDTSPGVTVAVAAPPPPPPDVPAAGTLTATLSS